MNYRGRSIDPLSVWERYVDFPSGVRIERDTMFLPLVQCPNPDHDTLKRHYQINVQEPLVHCFAHCGISGTYDHAVAVIEGLYDKLGVDLDEIPPIKSKRPFERTTEEKAKYNRYARAQQQASKIILRNARPQISRKAHVQSRHTPRKQVAVADLSYDTYVPQFALEYLDRRGITPESVAKWGIGWHREEQRIVLPALDEHGITRFLIRRAVKDSQRPKYLYSEGFPKTSLLFGAFQADIRLIQSSGLILVEGSFDTIKLHQYGFRNTVAILGTGISPQQMRIVMNLRPKRVFLMFDRDVAGITNIALAAQALSRKYPLFVCRYPSMKYDPAELTEEEARNSVRRSIPYMKWNRKAQLARS